MSSGHALDAFLISLLMHMLFVDFFAGACIMYVCLYLIPLYVSFGLWKNLIFIECFNFIILNDFFIGNMSQS